MSNAYTAEERFALAIERGIIVDPEDQWLLSAYTWSVMNKGYVRTTLRGPRPTGYAMLHHCIVGQPIHDGIEVDHRDRSKLNNRRSNLHYLTKAKNQLNTERAQTIQHIEPAYRTGTYKVAIRRDNVRYYLGVFETYEDAVSARDNWLASHE